MSQIRGIEYHHTVRIINKDRLPIDIETIGVLLKIPNDNNIYLTLQHMGLNVEYVIFNEKKYKDFNYSNWSENIIIKINQRDILKHQYVFKKFGMKCIDVDKKIKLNNYYCEYIRNVKSPVNMMRGNPELLYYEIRSEEKGSPKTGLPLHYNNTLYGILSRYTSDGNKCFVMPYIFLNKSIKNEKNNLYYCENYNKIKKINNYNVSLRGKDKMIYCKQFQAWMFIDSYLLYLSNSTDRILYNNQIGEYIKFTKIKKTVIKNTFLLHWCKLYNKDLLIEILRKEDTGCKKYQFELNREKQTYFYE